MIPAGRCMLITGPVMNSYLEFWVTGLRNGRKRRIEDTQRGALWKLWGFYQKWAGTPSALELEEALEKVDFRNVLIREEAREVKSLKPGLGINLGGTGKGYALDRDAGLLENKQAENFLLNAGNFTFSVRGAAWLPERRTGE